MIKRCPHCGALQSNLKLIKVCFFKKQICANCSHNYSVKINYENDRFPYLDWDVLIIGLIATVFINSWYVFALLTAFLFGLQNFRRVELIPTKT
jgi:hypothetical protein